MTTGRALVARTCTRLRMGHQREAADQLVLRPPVELGHLLEAPGEVVRPLLRRRCGEARPLRLHPEASLEEVEQIQEALLRHRFHDLVIRQEADTRNRGTLSFGYSFEGGRCRRSRRLSVHRYLWLPGCFTRRQMPWSSCIQYSNHSHGSSRFGSSMSAPNSARSWAL